MKCELCRYWKPAHQRGASAVGDCRRRAPNKVDDLDAAVWPQTKDDDSCGEYEPITLMVYGAKLEAKGSGQQTVTTHGGSIDLKG